MAEQTVIQYLVWHIQDKNSNARISLVMDYTPNARNDRTERTYDVFTLKHFTRFLNELRLDRVFILDPHSSVTTALLNRVHVDESYLASLITQAITCVEEHTEPGSCVVYYPDNGAAKRLSKLIDYRYIRGDKERDWETGEILGTQVLDVTADGLEGNTVLIVDDICSYGGTFIQAAEALKKLGVAHIYLYVTHCENSVLQGNLLTSGLIDGVFTTRSIFTGEHPLITILEG